MVIGLKEEFARHGLTREGRLIISTLKVSKNHDVSDMTTGKLLQQKGYVKQNGRISSKGNMVLGLLK